MFIAAFGGILYVLPSKQDRLLSKLRLQARARGFTVTAVSLPKTDASAEEKVSSAGVKRNPVRLCVSYRKTQRLPLERSPSWTLTFSTASISPIGGWQISDHRLENVDASDEDYWSAVEAAIESLPATCYGIAVDTRGAAWIGREKFDRDFEAFLSDLEKGLTRLQKINEEVHLKNVKRAESNIE